MIDADFREFHLHNKIAKQIPNICDTKIQKKFKIQMKFKFKFLAVSFLTKRRSGSMF